MPSPLLTAPRRTALDLPRAPLGAAQGVVADMERQSLQGQRFVQQDRALTAAVCGATAPPVPSVAQCLAGLDELW